MSHWHLIYTKPHQEKVALDNLTRQNYQCYLPLIHTEKILRGKKILSKEPMFPRYLFVRLSHDGKEDKKNNTIMVKSFDKVHKRA
jgi:transcriptional antiterminator RfaH